MGPDISMDNALLQQLLLWNSEEGMSILRDAEHKF